MEDDHLLEADRHLAEARSRITRQDQIVRDMKAAGHDTALAESLLEALLTTHERLIEHRRVIVATLALQEKGPL